ncbi:HK97 family phage prohead protease [Desulfovibrio desulfuricans]|uniref:HK97 family phage prohead protease n=1 Tax=Desulfovibrio desulfuricans TaxID=876 RepID=UPI001AE4B45B|nr:HK97 family phage prohead protease [Desulfovibrio desulfuricans]QTO39220.1 HK97 family phage prohead protease [Desulfovibrio desulfuricans]
MLAGGVIERRRAADLSVAPGQRKLVGYAAVFGQETRISDFTEVIRPGAFAASLKGRDILALVDHDPSRLLARTKSGTLRLEENSKGLRFELDLPDTTEGRDILALTERGDIGGMSFGFTVARSGERWDGKKRELRAVTLHEISVVHAWPAYQGTSVEPRARRPHLEAALLYLETI